MENAECLVVMGVSGSGKSTIARAVAETLGWAFAEGDDFHPEANVAKMRAGEPLTDEDRWPWLDLLASWIAEQHAAGRNAVVTCSALRRAYRDHLRDGRPWVRFCVVDVPRAELAARLAARRGHFMGPALLDSQLATLEPLAPDEPGTVVDGTGPADVVLARVLSSIAPWWQSAVVYQIYPRSFADASGDGVGDLPGILQRLDHLERLGVDAVWLSPVYPSPMDDNGYDISDYQDVDPVFGTLEDLDELIEALHRRGMKLLLDLVVNHTSDEHPWFVESRSSPDSPKRDWYWWRPARGGTSPGERGAEPNNWGSFFSGSAWEYDAQSGEYYLHLFSRKQPDLNWENPEVRHAIHDMMRWWLDRGVDGFRLDVVNMISKDPALPDGPVRPGEEHGVMGRSVIDGPRIHEFLAEMNREVFAGVDRELLLVGETPGVSLEEARKYTAPERRELDMVFQFQHLQVDRGEFKWDVRPFDMRLLRGCLAEWQEGLADVGWNSLYWDNHDQPRVVSRYGDADGFREESAKLLATVLHLQRGTPYVYQGDELGMTNYPFASIQEFDDIESVNFFHEAVARGEDPHDVLASVRAMSRDNGRTPMQWDDSPHGGFTKGVPWLPVNPNHEEVNASRQVGVPGSVFEHYRALIRLRHEEPTVAYGDFTLLLPDHEQLFAFTRRHATTELVVVANFSGQTVELPGRLADSVERAELVIGDSRRLRMRPWESRVYRRG